MEATRSQFDLLRFAPMILAAPVMLFSIGQDGMAQSGKHPHVRHSERSSIDNAVDSVNLDYRARLTIMEEIRKNFVFKNPALSKDIPEPTKRVSQIFTATAYCIKNLTASGHMVRPGVVAADPRVLPLGSIIKIDAGKYSGTYQVLDTGPAVKGKILDIYIPSRSDAVVFGRRKIEIEVLRFGWGEEKNEFDLEAFAEAID
jgi:3D (Asp-Asp-Asp) domain-containing protein